MDPAWSAASYDRTLLRAALDEGDRRWDAEANLLQVEAPYNPIHTHIKGASRTPPATPCTTPSFYWSGTARATPSAPMP